MSKEYDQFLCDYLIPGSTVSVDANWLQAQLRDLEVLKVKQKNRQQVHEELRQLRQENRELRQMIPEFHLNVRV